MALFLDWRPGAVGGTLLSSVGKQQRAVWVGWDKVGFVYDSFPQLMAPVAVTGSGAGAGISLFLANLSLLAVRNTASPSGFRWAGITRLLSWWKRGALVAMRSLPFGLAGDLLAWAGAVGFVSGLARYRFDELGQLLR